MNYHDVEKLIEEGEGFQVEFKRRISSPEKIARAMISFANTKGGNILFGVGDDGAIIGVESEKTESELIHVAGVYHCDPPIRPTIHIIPFNGKDVIVAVIGESGEKPHMFLGDNAEEERQSTRVYIRIKDKTVIASKEVVRILRDERIDSPPLKISIGRNERALLDYLDKRDRITVSQFSRFVNISERRASRILVKLVRAGVVRIHTLEKEDFYTLAYGR
ncbi:MAG: RNA-binding domain-containing protein [Bacteroidota bacterium]